MKVNEPGRQNVSPGSRRSRQSYILIYSGLNREKLVDSSGTSAEEPVMSASALPHCESREFVLSEKGFKNQKNEHFISLHANCQL